MFNIAILTGRLTADPELKTTPNGLSVCSFSIAVDRAYKKGEEKQTDFINCVAWRQTAEFISKWFSRGNLIGIEGAIQTRKYTDKNGNNRIAFEVVVNNAHFIESKKNNENSVSTNISIDPLNIAVDNLKNTAEKSGDSTWLNIDDEDLPF